MEEKEWDEADEIQGDTTSMEEKFESVYELAERELKAEERNHRYLFDAKLGLI